VWELEKAVRVLALGAIGRPTIMDHHLLAGVASGVYRTTEALEFLHFFLGGKRGRFIQPA
jgi:hypothetical protein